MLAVISSSLNIHGLLFYDQYPLEYNVILDVRPCCRTPVQHFVKIQQPLLGSATQVNPLYFT